MAVLRAELGEVDRFAHTDQAVAYAGMDVKIKESGKWKGKAKLSKRGSGLLPQMLYLAALRSIRLEGSAFGAYYHHLVERGLKKMSAVMAVMRKMVTVATHLIQTGEDYDSSLLFPPRPSQAEVSRPTRSGLGRALCAFKPSVVLGGLTNSMASVEKVYCRTL